MPCVIHTDLAFHALSAWRSGNYPSRLFEEVNKFHVVICAGVISRRSTSSTNPPRPNTPSGSRQGSASGRRGDLGRSPRNGAVLVLIATRLSPTDRRRRRCSRRMSGQHGIGLRGRRATHRERPNHTRDRTEMSRFSSRATSSMRARSSATETPRGRSTVASRRKSGDPVTGA